MSVKLELREWLTVLEAAEYLSKRLNEKWREADLLRLALDGQLTISVNFVNHARARLGRVVPIADAKRVKLRKLPGLCHSPEGDSIKGICLDEDKVLELSDEVVSIHGIWDLTLLGGERLDVEHRFQILTNGPDVSLVALDGTFVSRPDGQWAALQDALSARELESYGLPERVGPPAADDYFPAGGLPKNCHLVYRTSALTKLMTDKASARSQEAPGWTDTRVGGPKLAQWLEAKMKTQKLTLTRLAKLSGVDKKTIKALLAGQQRRKRVLIALAAELGVDVAEIQKVT